MRKFWLFVAVGILLSTSAYARQEIVERDDDGDGRKESKWTEDNGTPVRIQRDKNFDGKIDENITFKKGLAVKGEADADYNGKIDTWVEFDPRGQVKLIKQDRFHKDGKADTWLHYKENAVYRRESDRNFDGKPDFFSLEDHGNFLEKQYDNDYDGKYETVEKAPKIGTVERVVGR